MKFKEFVISVLREDEVVGKVPVLGSWHDTDKGFPQITIEQLYVRPISYSDDRVDLRECTLQIDVWHEGNPFPLAWSVMAALERHGLYESEEREINEEDVNRVMLIYKGVSK
jgi:hypothetical protein